MGKQFQQRGSGECKGKHPESKTRMGSGEHWGGDHTLEELSEAQGKILCH